MNIHPIKTEQDYEATLVEIDQLMEAEFGSLDGDRLDVLVTLIEAYETKNHSITVPDPIDAIRFRMEQMGLSRKDLEPYIGSRARVAEILNRKRQLSLDMIRRLHDGLKIPAEVLIQSAKT
jgi:HTH-type transcriptional regulator / antitoxin HigA